jgi:GNAT superfamily N-acetyltransferase
MVKIRKAKLKEVDDIVELWKRFMDEHRGMGRIWKEDRIPDFKDDAPDIVEKYFSRSIRSGNGFVLVLEDRGKINGYMLSRIQKNIPVFDKEYVGYVSDIYLNEPYRGKGFSSKMFKESLEWFHSKDITEISIRVMCCNPHARSIYDHWGFKDIHVEMRMDL